MRFTALCFLMAVCAWGSYFYGNGFYMAALAQTHGWSISEISSAITLGFWACIPASIVYGWVFDLHGRRWGALWVVGYGAIAMGSGIAGLGRVDALWQLYLVYALMGSAYPALAAPAISATLHQRVHRRYGLSLGVALSGASVGRALAAPTLLWATGRFGFAETLAGLGGLIVLLLLPLAVWIRCAWRSAAHRDAAGSMHERVLQLRSTGRTRCRTRAREVASAAPSATRSRRSRGRFMRAVAPTARDSLAAPSA